MKLIIGKYMYWVGSGLFVIGVLVIALGLFAVWYNFNFGWIPETLSPSSIQSFIATAMVLAPGVGLRLGGDKLIQLARSESKLGRRSSTALTQAILEGRDKSRLMN